MAKGNLSITTIQCDLKWEDKVANMAHIENQIKQLTNKTHLVVLPEMFNTGFSMNAEALAESMEGPTVQWMKRIAVTHKIIITGSLIITEEGNYFNRLIWMLPDGNLAYYDKRHLFGYAREDRHFTAGKKRLITSVNGWKINLLVCYDLRFPVWSRQQINKTGNEEFDLLIYVANWPEKRMVAWKTLLQARAIENQCYVIGVNRIGTDANQIYYNGGSRIIDPLGKILYEKESTEEAFEITLNKQTLEEIRSTFPFLKDADNFSISTD